MKIRTGAGNEIEVPRWGKWWKPLARRGTVDTTLLSGQPHEVTPELAKRFTDYQLHHFPLINFDPVNTAVLQAELRRRENWVAVASLCISVAALIVAFLALFVGPENAKAYLQLTNDLLISWLV